MRSRYAEDKVSVYYTEVCCGLCAQPLLMLLATNWKDSDYLRLTNECSANGDYPPLGICT